MEQNISSENLENFRRELLAEIREVLKQPQVPQKKWLKTAEMKQMFGMSKNTLQTLRKNWQLPYSWLGGTLYFSLEDVNTCLEENKRRAQKLHTGSNEKK